MVRLNAAAAECYDGVECVPGNIGDCLMDGVFGKLGRFADHVHGHANARAAGVRTKCDVFLGGDSERVVEQANGTGQTDGGYDCGDRGGYRLENDITHATTDLPGNTLDPGSFIIDSAMQQASEVKKGQKRRVNRSWNDNGVLDAWQHGDPPTEAKLCADFKGKTRTMAVLLEVEELALDVETSAVATE